MQRTKSVFLAVVLSLVLSIGMSPATAYAAAPPHPVCNHGKIGTPASTMYEMGRVTYGYDEYGRYCEKVWYKCSLCGYEMPLYFPVEE